MIPENRPYPTRFITVCALIVLFILVIGALRALEQPIFRSTAANSRDGKMLPDSVIRRDEIDRKRWPEGFQLHRYWWIGGAAVYIAEMDRTAENLQFDIELANNQILGRETITNATRRLMLKKYCPLQALTGASASERTPTVAAV